MITINQRNIWYIVWFIWNCFIFSGYYDLTYMEGNIRLGTLAGICATITGFVNFFIIVVACVRCFNNEITFEYQIRIPFYKYYVQYKANKAIKLRKIDLLNQAVISFKEDNPEGAERILIEYNKLEI